MLIRIWSDFLFSGSLGWTNFYNKIHSSKTVNIVDVNDKTLADYAISFNYTNQALEEIISCKIPIQNRILVMLECEAIQPRMHSSKILEQFGMIISPSKYWAPNREKVLINYPVISSLQYSNIHPSTQKYKFGFIQSNKFSCVKGEMYTFRRLVIKEFKKRKIDLQLAGKYWDRSPFENVVNYYRALLSNFNCIENKKIIWLPRALFGVRQRRSIEIRSKQIFLQTLKYCIVIENSSNYVSEKIFDCFKAGVVPIYVGPPLAEFGIPAETVISAPDNIDGFFEIIKNIENFPTEEILKDGERFLKSGAHDWTEMVSLAKIADIVLKEIEN